MALVADADPGAAHNVSSRVFRPDVATVVHRCVVDDHAAVDAGVTDAPAGAGHDHVVDDDKIGPVSIEGVDALKNRRERQLRIGLADDPVAVDHDVAERTRITLHPVLMGADTPDNGNVKVIMSYRDVARRVVDT